MQGRAEDPDRSEGKSERERPHDSPRSSRNSHTNWPRRRGVPP
jgi:hypothetical protein